MATRNSSKAEQWLEVIDKPISAFRSRPSKGAIERMHNAAVGEVEYYGTWIYIFADGSTLYEKNRDDWRTGNEYRECPCCYEWRIAEDEYSQSSLGICNECHEDQKEAAIEMPLALICCVSDHNHQSEEEAIQCRKERNLRIAASPYTTMRTGD